MIFESVIGFVNVSFGFSPVLREWEGANKLPLFMKKGYSFKALVIQNHTFILMDCSSKNDLGIDIIKKHVNMVRDVLEKDGQIILIFDTMSKYITKQLVKESLSFIVPGKQIYAPTMGLIYNERQQTRYTPDKIQSQSYMKPSTQALFLYLMVEKNFSKTMEELAVILDVSKMTISRGFSELKTLHLVKDKEDNDRAKYQFCGDVKEVWINAQNSLINPVQREIIVFKDSIDSFLKDKLVISGEYALSEFSMLSKPKYRINGISNKEFSDNNFEVIELPIKDSNAEIIQLWKHEMPVENGVLHPLAIALVLKDEEDERIQSEVKKMINDYFSRSVNING